MGLLGENWDDPRTMAALQMGAGLLAAGGPSRSPTNLGMGLLGGLNQYQDVMAQANRQKLLEQEMGMRKDDLAIRQQEAQRRLEEAQRMQQEREAAKLQLQQVLSWIDTNKPELSQLARINPQEAIKRAFPEPKGVTKVGPGETLVDQDTFAPKFTAPQSADKEPEFVRLLRAEGIQEGSPQWNAALAQYRQNRSTHAPGTSVNLSVNTEKNMLGALADQVGKNVASTNQAAQAAAGTLQTVGRIREALSSPNVMAGPMTTPMMVLRQVGEVAGFQGKDGTETLTNTRQVIQGLAQLELDAAQQMRGQGQITEAERAIIRRAAAGDIDKMTKPELMTLMGVLDKTARAKITANEENLRRLQGNPNAAPVVDFLKVQPPGGNSVDDLLRKYGVR